MMMMVKNRISLSLFVSFTHAYTYHLKDLQKYVYLIVSYKWFVFFDYFVVVSMYDCVVPRLVCVMYINTLKLMMRGIICLIFRMACAPLIITFFKYSGVGTSQTQHNLYTYTTQLIGTYILFMLNYIVFTCNISIQTQVNLIGIV